MPSFATLDFHKAVVTGAAGGLGKAMAAWLVQQGKSVVLVGRTEATLAEAAAELGHVPYYVFDVAQTSGLHALAARIIADHPDTDCLINNAGVQRELYIEYMNLPTLDQEIDINIRAPAHLIDAFLPHFKSMPGAVIMNVSSILGIVPFSIINPGYNGTKAYLHFYTMALRAQLKHTNIKVVEVIPPGVHTGLHRDRLDPDDNKHTALSVGQFVAEIAQGWRANSDEVSAGPGPAMLDAWDSTFRAQFDSAAHAYDPATARQT